jgi:xanthine dehydrogenase YagS FAD-binding subunit
MRPFTYASERSRDAKYLAGGTTLVDLMKLDVERPAKLVDLNALGGMNEINVSRGGLRIGALVTMADAAANETVLRDYPVIAQSLLLAASAQIRNMASLGGNTLQRTRCSYFRDTSYEQCNKRIPGSGCAARDGFNRSHAVLGTSEQCVAAYPGDFALALLAVDAEIETDRRRMPFAELHRTSEEPSSETNLREGEMIRYFHVPGGPHRRSLYRKIRDRDSYQFAVTSAAVRLDMDGDTVRDARIALGGVAYKPWRSERAESAIKGKLLTQETAVAAGEQAFANARPLKHNAFKIELGKMTLVRALIEAKSLET